MPKLEKLLHDVTNIMQAIAGHLELAKDQNDKHLSEARKLTSDMFKILRQLRKHLEQ